MRILLHAVCFFCWQVLAAVINQAVVPAAASSDVHHLMSDLSGKMMTRESGNVQHD